MDRVAAIQGYLHRETEAMIDLLERFVRIETPSDVPESQRPMLALLEDTFADIGYRSTCVPARRRHGGHLYARPDGRPARDGRPAERSWQLLLGHCDTVWPIGTLREMPVEMRDGKLYGPGVFDMKAGLVQAIFALRTLRELGVEPAVEPLMFINSDEEIGSRESRRYIERLAPQMDRVFVLEPSLGPAGKLISSLQGTGRLKAAAEEVE